MRGGEGCISPQQCLALRTPGSSAQPGGGRGTLAGHDEATKRKIGGNAKDYTVIDKINLPEHSGRVSVVLTFKTWRPHPDNYIFAPA